MILARFSNSVQKYQLHGFSISYCVQRLKLGLNLKTFAQTFAQNCSIFLRVSKRINQSDNLWWCDSVKYVRCVVVRSDCPRAPRNHRICCHLVSKQVALKTHLLNWKNCFLTKQPYSRGHQTIKKNFTNVSKTSFQSFNVMLKILRKNFKIHHLSYAPASS